MERQKQNYRIGFPIASIYSAKLRPNRLGPNIQNQQKIKGPDSLTGQRDPHPFCL